MQTGAADTGLQVRQADNAPEFQRESPARRYPTVFTIPAGCFFNFRQRFGIE